MPTPIELTSLGGVVALDLASGDGAVFHLSSTENVTSWTVSNASDGDTFLLKAKRNTGHTLSLTGLIDVWLDESGPPPLPEDAEVWVPVTVDGSSLIAQSVPSNEQAINAEAASYAFAMTDSGTIVESTSASALTFTVPTNASVAFPVGTRLDATQYGAGVLSIAAAAGVTIRSLGGTGTRALAGQYASATLYKRATNEWVLVGAFA